MDRGDRAAERIIAAARRGDQSDVSRWLESYRPFLKILAQGAVPRDLRHKLDPSDLAQETLTNASRYFGDFRGKCETELASWLRGILKRRISTWARYHSAARRAVGREQPFDEVLDGLFDKSAEAVASLAALSNGNSSVHGGRDPGVVVTEVLALLSEEYRQVITLRSIEGLEWAEVARIMGRSTEAVRKLRVRALKKLRALIEGRP